MRACGGVRVHVASLPFGLLQARRRSTNAACVLQHEVMGEALDSFDSSREELVFVSGGVV